jgi:hypothetical protein
MRAILCLALVAGCSDFELPSALSREQILAVRATPPVVPAGGRARLDALIAGPAGVVEGATLAWSLPEGAGASLEADGEATWLVAGTEDVRVDLEATTPAGETLLAEKRVRVGEAKGNPMLVGLEADGRPMAGELALPAGGTATLAAQLDAPEQQRTTWFATVGEIERYLQNPTDLVAPEAPVSGWLLVVARDGDVGVAWQIVPLRVE